MQATSPWLVATPQTEPEFEALRRAIKRGQPFGNDVWGKRTAGNLSWNQRSDREDDRRRFAHTQDVAEGVGPIFAPSCGNPARSQCGIVIIRPGCPLVLVRPIESR